MSYGDGKNSVKFLSNKDTRKKKKYLGIDEFAHAIARIAVAQVCEGLGFQGFHQSALDTLADVGVRYIKEVGRSATICANSMNRSQCNVFDVIQGLEDLGSVQGFSGASDVRHSLSGSGVVKDMIHYVGQAEEIPFAYLVPGFPVVKERRLNPSFAQVDENPPDEHIPNWLPKFPDPETFNDLKSLEEKDSDTGVAAKIQQLDLQHEKVERSPRNLQKKLMCNGSEAGVAFEEGDASKAHQAAESNPFLAPPLQFGEKEVSLPVLPTKFLDESAGHHQSREVMKNDVSALEPLFPANKSATSGPFETEDIRKTLLDDRPKVHIKFGNHKKSLGMVSNPFEGIEKISFWFADDRDGKDEKKRRTEQILWENMEHSREVSDL